MVNFTGAFAGYSCDDLGAADTFYTKTLGLDTELKPEMEYLSLKLPGAQRVMLYRKDGHQPATYTVLNFEVDDIEAAVDSMAAAGVMFDNYGPEWGQDERGIAREPGGTAIAWFKDPAGNILAVVSTP